MTELPFRVTFQPSEGPARISMTVLASSEEELERRLQAVESNGTLATIARLSTGFSAAFQAQANLGGILGAKMEGTPASSAPIQPAAAPAAAPVAPQQPHPSLQA